jgi:hypothetical protein
MRFSCLLKVSQTVFLCVLEDWVNAYCKHPNESPPPPIVGVGFHDSHGAKFNLHFKTGEKCVNGETAGIYSVVGYCPKTVDGNRYDDLASYGGSDV